MHVNVDKKWIVPSVVGLVSFGVGAGIGYVLGKRGKEEVTDDPEQLSFDFQTAEAVKAVEKTNDFIESLRSSGREIVEDVIEEVEEFEEDHGWKEVVQSITVEEDDNMINIFVNDDDWDYAVELPNRSPDRPYVIHVDEYVADEMEFDHHVTLMYYAGDDILVDELDVPIYNYQKIVGELKFGHGSQDPNIVYVRNEKLQLEYEILNNPESFQVEVLGDTIEGKGETYDFKHAIRRFKMKE